MKTFKELLDTGKLKPEDVDDYVDRYNQSEETMPMFEYLGFKDWREYDEFIEDQVYGKCKSFPLPVSQNYVSYSQLKANELPAS